MEVQAPRLEDMRISPQLGAIYRAGDHIAVRVNGYRRLRAPTVGQLYAPLVLDAAIVAANPQLHAESVWGGELGPELHAGPLTARAIGFWHEIDAPIAAVGGARTNLDHARVLGVATEAMWRPVRPVLATVSYTRSASRIRDAALAGNELSFAPRHRGAALLTFEGSRIATLTGGVRVIGRQVLDASTSSTLAPAALVDAMAARTLAGGLAGFIAVENLLDRRNVAGDDLLGPGRTIQLGLRLDSARF
jgi:outer membrane receptor protein involved in Fe transport